MILVGVTDEDDVEPAVPRRQALVEHTEQREVVVESINNVVVQKGLLVRLEGALRSNDHVERRGLTVPYAAGWKICQGLNLDPSDAKDLAIEFSDRTLLLKEPLLIVPEGRDEASFWSGQRRVPWRYCPAGRSP